MSIWLVELKDADGKWRPINQNWGLEDSRRMDGTRRQARELCEDMRERFPDCKYRVSKYEKAMALKKAPAQA